MPDLNSAVEVAYKPSMEAGFSYDLSLGSIRRVAVTDTPASSFRSIPIADGQRTKYFCTIIDSLESLYEQLSISLDGSTRNVYASGSLSLSQDQYKIFNSHQTFIVARVEVKNAFLQYDEHARLDPIAVKMLEEKRYNAFKNAYGDGYFRGMLTGGCFYAIISLLSKSLDEQRDLSIDLQGKIAGGTASINTSIDSYISQYSSSTKIQILTYQDAGRGPQSAVIETTFEALGQRMRDFTTFAFEHPTPIYMHIAPYITLSNCPDTISLHDIEHQSKMLTQYKKIEFDYITMLNDIAFVKANRDFFADAPTMDILNGWSKKISDSLNKLYEVSRACSDSADKCPVVDFELPSDYRAIIRNSDGPSQEESLLLGKTWHFTNDENKTTMILTRNALTSSFTGTSFYVDTPDKPPVVGIRAIITLNGCVESKLITITLEYPEITVFDSPTKGFAQSMQGFFADGDSSKAYGDCIYNFHLTPRDAIPNLSDWRLKWKAHISQTAPQPLLMAETLQPSTSSEASSFTASCSTSSSSSSIPSVLPQGTQRISLSMFRNIFASQEQKELLVEKLFIKYGLGTKEKVLRQAILHRDTVVVSELLGLSGIEINEKDATTGRTALHEAYIIGNHEIVDLLLAKGADKTLIDKDGKTPEHYFSELLQASSIALS